MPSSCSTRGTQHDLTPLILESLDEGVFTVDADFSITSFNAAAERITQTSRAAAIGRKWSGRGATGESGEAISD